MQNKRALELFGTGYRRLNNVLDSFNDDNEQILGILNESDKVIKYYNKVFSLSFDELEIEDAFELIIHKERIDKLDIVKSSTFTDKAFAETIAALSEMQDGLHYMSNVAFGILQDKEVMVEGNRVDIENNFNSFKSAYEAEILYLIGKVQYKKVVEVANELRQK